MTRPRGPSLCHDAAGNMNSKTGGGVSNTLTWDAENKRSRVVVGGLGYNHVHDANHARVVKITGASGGTPERATIYLGGDAEIDDQGTETGFLYLNARYYDPVLARFNDPVNKSDENGHAIEQADSAGGIEKESLAGTKRSSVHHRSASGCLK